LGIETVETPITVRLEVAASVSAPTVTEALPKTVLFDVDVIARFGIEMTATPVTLLELG
jgi:hypothetical protein